MPWFVVSLRQAGESREFQVLTPSHPSEEAATAAVERLRADNAEGVSYHVVEGIDAADAAKRAEEH